MSNDLVKCNVCKKDKEINCFMKKDKQLKNCENCRTYHRNNKMKNKCPCGKRKEYCKLHGGNALCQCGIRKSNCKIHGGSVFCQCGIRKSYCKIHGGSVLCQCGKQKVRCKLHGDARKIVIERMIGDSRQRDKKKNIFDENQFIDKQFVSNLLDLYKNCIYCNLELNFDKLNSKLATIERLDNTLGHIKRNCVIACFKCNNSRVGDKYN